jgi:hypothetical protein
MPLNYGQELWPGLKTGGQAGLSGSACPTGDIETAKMYQCGRIKEDN